MLDRTNQSESCTGYIRPQEGGNDWFQSTTTIWRLDELMRSRLKAWKTLLGEDGYNGSRTNVRNAPVDTVYSGKYSVFPPPLVERIILRYGGTPGGVILDSFAGGPSRGAVSALMGYHYLGYEIRQEQIGENLAVMQGVGVSGVEYRCSDGTLLEGCAPASVDCAITCPPYYKMELYSDLPNDLSNLPDYESFTQAMLNCAMSHKRVMKPGAFVCIVTAPFRLKNSAGVNELVDFPGHTITAFKKAGFYFWQKVIISRSGGSAAVRAATHWRGKKLVSTHEELLVFKAPDVGVAA